MNQAEPYFQRIQDKLQQLLKGYSTLQKENARLKDDLQKKEKEGIACKEEIEKLKQQVNVLKLGSGEMTGADKKEFEKKINTYLKEIDRCIAMLGE